MEGCNEFSLIAGLQCYCGVLLGTIFGWVKFRWSQYAQHIEPDHHAWINPEAWQELEECGLPHLQYLYLVDEHFQYENSVSTIHIYCLDQIPQKQEKIKTEDKI